MRYREPFTVYPRQLPSGRIVYYYQTYDENNKRTAPHSTGQRTKTAARHYCHQLNKTNTLIPNKKDNLTFAEYAQGWWDFKTCEYIAYKLKRTHISPIYANNAKKVLKNYILPYFNSMRLIDINQHTIEQWINHLQKKTSKNSSINHYLRLLSTMLSFAVHKGIIPENPFKKVLLLKDNSQSRGILTTEEVQKLFDPTKIIQIWKTPLYHTINLLAACTGMRMGEVLATRVSTLKENSIIVDKQFDRTYGLRDTKTREIRQIPIPENLNETLHELAKNKTGFLFSKNNHTQPVANINVLKHLYTALNAIGISPEERKKRNITFHSWRHYFNTVLRSHNINDGKVQTLTGHKTKAMTNHYTHFTITDFSDVLTIQNTIVPKQPS